MVKVAFIGLGALGYPMARHLIQGGYDVTVYNRSAANAANGRRRSVARRLRHRGRPQKAKSLSSCVSEMTMI